MTTSSNFLVYVLESPSPDDFYQNRKEGEALSSVLNLCGIDSKYRLCVRFDMFVDAIVSGVPGCLSEYPSIPMVLHISAHGDENGIQLTDGTIVNWATLRHLFVYANKIYSQTLIVCMSTCKGYSACRTSMVADLNAEIPYYALIGCAEDIAWSKTVIGYSTLYHNLNIKTEISNAVTVMNFAAGTLANKDYFFLSFGVNEHKGFVEYCATQISQGTPVELEARKTEIAGLMQPVIDGLKSELRKL